MEKIKPKRLFIAIDLPPEQKVVLGKIIARLKKEFPDLRYEKVEKLHLTLKFLGWTRISEERIEEALNKITSPTQPFNLSFTGLDFFFSFNFILFINLQENKALLDLVRKVEDEMRVLGFPKERRPFRSHITLARGKRKPLNYWKELSQKISLEKFPLPESFKVSEIVLMESILEREGSKYKILSNFPLTE